VSLNILFDKAELDPRLKWMNPPARWSIDVNESALVVMPAAGTDFWQKTHSGIRADSGCLLYARMEGDFRMSTRVRLQLKHQYDQAGLMVRISEDCWIKTSVENETDKASVVGAVVTNCGYSDWSTQPFEGDEVEFQIFRQGADYLVHWRETGQPWQQLRMCHLHGDDGHGSALGGLYACCPRRAGLVAKFRYLTIDTAAG
jgi:regulation of enolase protein 1 (concanavalin A-like superfamily)